MEDIERLWHAGLDPLDLIDAGLVLTSTDFPAPLSDVCESLATVSLDCSIEEAEVKIQTLLMEAQAARQWSVPWGARVEVAFGSFVSVRIFEIDGEFTCLFLDDQERYFHVAVGLRHQPPQSSTHHLVRMRSDDGLPMWNEDAELSLKLIAAAIVRDFIVVEERESLFTCRPMRRRLRGRDVRTVIYLPRVRYTWKLGMILGLAVGSTMVGERFLQPSTLLILLLVATAISVASRASSPPPSSTSPASCTASCPPASSS